jgi:NAD(P)H-flavin reductase
MPVPSYQLVCTGHKKIAHDVYEFTFQRPGELTFRAGQFVLFDVPLLENPTDIQTRAFSIASTPMEDELLFVAKLKQGGRASRWIETSLKTGDTVRTQGPFGNFVIHRENQKELLFIATSTGVAPFRSQILDTLESGFAKQIDLVFGVRNQEDLFWKEEFQKIAQQYEHFNLHIALSGNEEEWTGHRGRVQTLVTLICKDFSTKKIYVCGSPDMTKEMKRLCLEEWGVQKTDLHVEGYI